MNRKFLTDVERNLYLPVITGFFVLGVWLAPRLATGLWPLWLLLFAALLIIPLQCLRMPIRLIGIPIVLMLAILWTQYWLNPVIPEEGWQDQITATVYGDSKINDSGNVVFVVTDIAFAGEKQQGKAYAFIYVDDDEDAVELSDGMRIQFSGSVYLPDEKENEYDFDFAMWMLQKRMNFGISSVQDVEILSEDIGWTNYADRVFNLCYQKLEAAMGDRADLAAAMLFGEQEVIAEDDAAMFKQAGVAHIMAVSGLHVGILSMAVVWLLNRLRTKHKFQILIVGLFLVLYCWITGFAVSSVRAAVMVVLWMTAKAAGRQTNSISIVSAAMLFVLIINPLQLFSAGFILSFSAIGGIALLYPRILSGVETMMPPLQKRKRNRIRRYFAEKYTGFTRMLAVSLAAQVGVALPIAAYFHNFYLYGLLFNLLIIPFVGLLIPLYAVTLLVSWIPLVGEWIAMAPGVAASLGSEAVLWLVRQSQNLPWAAIRTAEPNGWICAAALVCAITVSRYVRGGVKRRMVVIGISILVAAAGTIASQAPSLRYHQLSVGNADAALIIDGDITIGIDTGSNGTEMINRLLGEGRDLDALILTHLHSDHAGGVEAILEEGIKIDRIYLPVDLENHDYSSYALSILQTIEDYEIPITYLAAGDTLQFHETTIEILWPEEGHTRTGTDANERSLAMLITMGGVRILSMADNGELYEMYAVQSADVLKTGHHGSSSASLALFLAAADPAVAIMTVREGSYSPSASTLERFAELDIPVLLTYETGELTIVPTQSGYRVYRYLTEETD